MEHVVFYQSAQGAPAFRRLGSLEDAVSFAEHLRNVEGVTDFSVYSLSPVTLSLRAYYHVEVSNGDASATAAAAAPAVVVPTPDSPFAAPGAPATPPALPPMGAEAVPPLPPQAPPMGEPLAAGSPTPSLSFNALEEEASAPVHGAPTPADDTPAPVASVPFAAAPLPPPGGAASITETFVKDDPAEVPPPADVSGESSIDSTPLDPSVVDPTVEEVVPAAPPGRRSMGFFARS